MESFIGVSGQVEGYPQLPDGEFLPPMEMNCVEKDVKKAIESGFPGRNMTIGRTAHLTVPHNGRGNCQFRNRCMRGCPYGAYFSSQSSTLPAARATGNLTIRPHSVVSEIIYDKDSKTAKGVRIKDGQSGEWMEFYAKVVFLCASALPSTQILMQSANDIWPEGLGSSSGELGHNIMDHHLGVGAYGWTENYEEDYYKGRRPNGIYVPRFRNVGSDKAEDFIRGYGYQGGAGREGWGRMSPELATLNGDALKQELMQPGTWRMNLSGFGEMLPYHDNKMTLNRDLLDKDGMPTLTFDVEYKENERNMRKDMAARAAEMLEASGMKDVQTYDRTDKAPGIGIHEMGSARMGDDPKKSVVNRFNQVHDCKNVYMTDGAFMTSAACQNPSLTYMAFTARAVDHAVSELNKQNL